MIKDWGELSPIFWSAVRTVSTLAFIMAAGIGLACFPRPNGTVQRPFMKALARLCFNFFLPCMLVTKIGAALAQGLDGWWPGLELEPDLDAVPALSDERAALWERVASADFLSAEEKKAMLGM